MRSLFDLTWQVKPGVSKYFWMTDVFSTVLVMSHFHPFSRYIFSTLKFILTRLVCENLLTARVRLCTELIQVVELAGAAEKTGPWRPQGRGLSM